jgi:hypothetical protein
MDILQGDISGEQTEALFYNYAIVGTRRAISFWCGEEDIPVFLLEGNTFRDDFQSGV